MQKPTRNLTNGTIVLTAQDLHSKMTNLLQKRHERQKNLGNTTQNNQSRKIIVRMATILLNTLTQDQFAYSRLLLKTLTQGFRDRSFNTL
jgi:hypothetical protein